MNTGLLTDLFLVFAFVFSLRLLLTDCAGQADKYRTERWGTPPEFILTFIRGTKIVTYCKQYDNSMEEAYDRIHPRFIQAHPFSPSVANLDLSPMSCVSFSLHC